MTEVLCSLIGAVIGAIISFLTIKRTIYNETVSQRRNLWLNEMREYISKMLACKEILNATGNPKGAAPASGENGVIPANCGNKAEIEKEYEIAKNQILIRLNMTEAKHQLLEMAITDLDTNSKDYNDVVAEIIEISRSILKDEWEKVKRETKGGK